jgi:excisionase family DNA binding protein
MPAVKDDVLASGLLSIAAAIEFSALSRSTLYNLMRDKRLPFVRVHGLRSIRIPKAALVELLRSGLSEQLAE